MRGYGDFIVEVPDREALYGAPDFAKVCPVCLDIWAILETPQTRGYRIVPSVCELCTPPLEMWNLVDYTLDPVPGSLISRPDRHGVSIDWHLFDQLPETLVRREATLTLAVIKCPQRRVA